MVIMDGINFMEFDDEADNRSEPAAATTTTGTGTATATDVVVPSSSSRTPSSSSSSSVVVVEEKKLENQGTTTTPTTTTQDYQDRDRDRHLPSSSVSVSYVATVPSMITTLQRQSISIVLSFLAEYDATNLLLCRKVWTTRLLPIFRTVLPPRVSTPSRISTTTPRSHSAAAKSKSSKPSTAAAAAAAAAATAISTKYRHRFMVVPVPDPMTRLERLNTKRLYERQRRQRRKQNGNSSRQGHYYSSSTATTSSATDDSDRDSSNSSSMMTTLQQIALKEWLMTIDDNSDDDTSATATAAATNTAPAAINASGSTEDDDDDDDDDAGRKEQHQDRQLDSSQQPPLLQFYNPTYHHYHHHHRRRRGRRSLLLFKPGKTVLASYPRSGNTLLRRLLETVTGFVTGSDTRPDRPLSLSLANDFDLVGEGVTGSLSSSTYFDDEGYNDNNNNNSSSNNEQSDGSITTTTTTTIPSTPIVKTHWPERIGWYPYDCHRVILLVRNPWDAIDSYWHLNATNTHTNKVVDGVYEDHYKLWIRLVRNEFIIWNDFLTYWHDHSQSQNRQDRQTPTKQHSSSNNNKLEILWVRYEDLVLHQERELERILKFCCSNDDGPSDDSSSDDTNRRCSSPRPWWKSRLANHISSSSSSSTSSSSSSSSIVKSIGRMIRQKRYPIDLLRDLHSMYNDNTTRSDTTMMNKRKIKKDINWIKVLGYDVLEQDFPNNLDSLPPLPQTKDGVPDDNTCSKMKVNESRSFELRSIESPFGRKMRDWRRQYTKNDTQPFPVVATSQSSTKYKKT